MKIGDIMKREVVSITPAASIAQAAKLFIQRHVGTLPVVDESRHPIGMLLLADVLSLVMPDFVRLVDDFDFVHDFGALESRKPSLEALTHAVSQVMQPPIRVEENSGLLRAFALLRQHGLHDLPVVSARGELVGIVSRVDIGSALLVDWGTPSATNPPKAT